VERTQRVLAVCRFTFHVSTFHPFLNGHAAALGRFATGLQKVPTVADGTPIGGSRPRYVTKPRHGPLVGRRRGDHPANSIKMATPGQPSGLGFFNQQNKAGKHCQLVGENAVFLNEFKNIKR
jgi:hypothetical protein